MRHSWKYCVTFGSFRENGAFKLVEHPKQMWSITCSWVIQYIWIHIITTGAHTYNISYTYVYSVLNALFDPNWKPTLINYLKIMYTNYALNGWREPKTEWKKSINIPSLPSPSPSPFSVAFYSFLSLSLSLRTYSSLHIWHLSDVLLCQTFN